jgi:hypothetical protein
MSWLRHRYREGVDCHSVACTADHLFEFSTQCTMTCMYGTKDTCQSCNFCGDSVLSIAHPYGSLRSPLKICISLGTGSCCRPDNSVLVDQAVQAFPIDCRYVNRTIARCRSTHSAWMAVHFSPLNGVGDFHMLRPNILTRYSAKQ